MRITGLTATEFPPFADLNISFPRQERKGTDDGSLAEVHLFTGENGTGKTRLLAMLAGALGNRSALDRRHLVAPNKLFVGRCSDDGRELPDWDCATNNPQYSHGIPDDVSCYAYSGHPSLKSHIMTPLAEVKVPDTRALLDFDRAGDEGKMISQCLYNYAMQAAAESFDDSSGNKKPSRWRRLLKNVQRSVQEITGLGMVLRPQTFPQTTLMVDLFGSSLTLDQIPDGLKAILSWAGDIIVHQELRFPDDPDPLGKPMIILMDEPETHLHPAWQRQVLPALQKLFRNAQIFVATHSPFVVSSLNEGWIHKFTRRADGRVQVKTEEARKGDTYMDAVEDILGLSPLQRFDPESQRLLEEFHVLLRKVSLGKAPRAELDRLAEVLRERGGEVAEVTETELCQLEPDRMAVR